jgi:1-acyl-sn-glycerol-3-phosphate acyltransferase
MGTVVREKGGFWLGVAASLFYPAQWVTGRRRFVGEQHIPNPGPAIIVVNHISYLDPVHTAVFVHHAGRVPRFMAKHTIMDLPLIGLLARRLEQIPVYRGGGDAKESLRAAIDALGKGRSVIIYPEGTITRDPDFWPMRARTGVARLALECDVPVIPVVHWNTHLVYDHYHGKKFRPLPRRTIVTQAGPPVDLSTFRGRPVDGTLLREVTDHIMRSVRDLLADVRGEPAPELFFQPQRDRG